MKALVSEIVFFLYNSTLVVNQTFSKFIEFFLPQDQCSKIIYINDNLIFAQNTRFFKSPFNLPQRIQLILKVNECHSCRQLPSLRCTWRQVLYCWEEKSRLVGILGMVNDKIVC